MRSLMILGLITIFLMGCASTQSTWSNSITAYELTFDGFSKQEVLQMEEYLVIFSGYQSHRVEYSGALRTEYWYKSSIGSAKLDRNLHKMLHRLDYQGVVQISGNTYTITKVSLRTKHPRQQELYEW